MPPNFYCHELALASCFESHGALEIAFRASAWKKKWMYSFYSPLGLHYLCKKVQIV